MFCQTIVIAMGDTEELAGHDSRPGLAIREEAGEAIDGLTDAHVCHRVFLTFAYGEIQWSLAEIFRVIALSFEHDELYRLRVGDVSQRVGRQYDKIRYCSGFDGAE